MSAALDPAARKGEFKNKPRIQVSLHTGWPDPGTPSIPYAVTTVSEALDRVTEFVWTLADEKDVSDLVLLDIIQPDNGRFFDIGRTKNGRLRARLRISDLEEEVEYQLLVWIRGQGLCLAYGGRPTDRPECVGPSSSAQDDDPSWAKAEGPQPPPKIEPPGGDDEKEDPPAERSGRKG